MGRDKMYPLNDDQNKNCDDLLKRVNGLLDKIEKKVTVTSGYRPGHFNKAAGGAARSGHLICKAIDLKDEGDFLKKLVTQDLLEEFDLYMEHPDYTKGWIHLDTTKRKNRIFIPY